METSSPTKEDEKVVSHESKAQDEENSVKCSPISPIDGTNAENKEANEQPVQTLENVLSEASGHQTNKSNEQSSQMVSEASEVASADKSTEPKDESNKNEETTTSAESEIKQDNSVPVQLNNVTESVPIVEKVDELMETVDIIQETTEPHANTSNNDAMKSTVQKVDELMETGDIIQGTTEPHANTSNDDAMKPTVQKADELMETGNIIQGTTEPNANTFNEDTMEESQSATAATVASESASQSNQEAEKQKPDETTVTAEASTELVADGVANADTASKAPEHEEPVKAVSTGQPGSLSLLAELYDSGNDSDVCEVPSMQNYQNRVIEINSETDSSSSSDDDEADNEPIDVEVLNAVHADDDEEEAVRSSRSPRVKGEFHLDDLPPIHELQITVPEDECTELGKIQSIIDQLVIVNSLPGTVPLDLDTVLFLDKGKKVLGEIFDVLGQVSDPLYCVRFNSNKDIKSKSIEVGQTVYVAPRTQHTQFVILANLMKERGSDASWEYDIEPPERYLDYSDDEEERSARRAVRNRNRPVEAGDEGPKRYRPADAPSPSGPRAYRGNYHDGPRMQQFPNNYRIAGNSWHSNFPQNYHSPQQQYNQYRPPPRFFRPPPRGMPVRPPAQHPGMVLNPYAVYPPPHLMQQPLFPPPTHQPPPPGPPGPHGGY